MTAGREQDQTPGTHPDSPGDIPAERPASLGRLDALIGQWEMEATFEAGYFGPDSPAFTGRGGRTTFEWLEGRFFLTQRFINEHPQPPEASRSSARAPGRRPSPSTTTTPAVSSASTR